MTLWENLHEKRCGADVTSYLVDPFGVLYGDNILAEVSFLNLNIFVNKLVGVLIYQISMPCCLFVQKVED